MDIKKHLDAMLSEPVQSPGDILFRTVCAAFIRTILLQCPVTDGQANQLDLALGQLFDVVFGQPRVPVGLE